MIGNDVVDLVLAQKESNWKRKGYLNKLFTTFEQELIQKASNQEEMVWMLWSIKESVYKAYQRINYNEGFYPIKIQIQSLIFIENQYQSIIKLCEDLFYGKTTVSNQKVNSFVVKHECDFKKIIFLDSINYSKDPNGLPYNLNSNNPLSVSHHGRFKEIIQLS